MPNRQEEGQDSEAWKEEKTIIKGIKWKRTTMMKITDKEKK